MELYADRLAKLAGLPARDRKSLNEASNRSYHDGDTSDDAEFRHGKGSRQLNEDEGEEADTAEGDEADINEDQGYDDREDERLGAEHGPSEGHKQNYHDRRDDAGFEMRHETQRLEFGEEPVDEGHHEEVSKHDDDLDELDDMVEINEEMLAEEIKRMRQERMQENELRSIIKKEISAVVKSMQKGINSDSQAKKPIPTRGITKGFPGPGFR